MDCSITRTRPFFGPLLRRDPSGESWLGRLIRLGEANPKLSEKLARESGPLLEWVSRRRVRTDRTLLRFGVPSIELEECFERRLPPPPEFLRWLIAHPETMAWPSDELSFGMAQRRREELFGHHGLAAASRAKAEALAELDRFGGDGSAGKWWAFEGFTHVDCLLETRNLILLIEGKRTEKLSATTRWFPQRNQLLRNLEVARSVAAQRHKQYAVLLIAEKHMNGLTLESIFASLPHMVPHERSDMINHYLGCITWSAALAAVTFPQTVKEAARRMAATAASQAIYATG